MRESLAVLGVVSSLGLFFVSAEAQAGEPGANPETQQMPSPNGGWTYTAPANAPAAGAAALGQPAIGPAAASGC